MPRQAWVFKCPICDYDQVRVYTAKVTGSAYVVCGRCRTLVTFDPAPRMGEAIDLYNLYCDAVRSRVGSYVEIPAAKQNHLTSKESFPFPVQKSKEARGMVVLAAPLCVQHDFVIGEPIRGFKGEMLAQIRICLKCGHAERDRV
jgi:transcription elongation factor Elf1